MISEPEFSTAIKTALLGSYGVYRSVSGPGRSGAIAAVYASHILRIPFIPYGTKIPDQMRPLLIIDTAAMSWKTIKKAVRKMDAAQGMAVFYEPPRVRFWYEEKH